MFFRLLTDSRLRAETRLRYKYRYSYHQNSSFTTADRYPLLFQQCKTYFDNADKPRILSFGCSTGEEVFTLKRYLPTAIITGVDINDWCIQQCNKKNTYTDCVFFNSLSEQFQNSTDFDAIFCMAVFQRTENRTNQNNETAMGFTFKQFEKEIINLDNKLKINGLLIIDHADFSFMDTTCADRYEPLKFLNNNLLRERPLFNKFDKKETEVNSNYRVFIKKKAHYTP